jgi:hypothetical protein
LIPADGTKLISKVLSLSAPEPSAGVLSALGLLVFGLRRRQVRN